MDLDAFSRQFHWMHERFLHLASAPDGSQDDTPRLWEEMREALGATIEEMRATQEELRRRNAELEQSRRALEVERQRYMDLFDFAPNAYLVTDLNGVIREANRAAGELLGILPKHLAGEPLASYVMLDDRPGFRTSLNRLLQVGRHEDWVVRIQPSRGGPYDASITAAVIRDSDGTPRGLRWIVREVVGPAWWSGGHAMVPPSHGGRVTIGRMGEVQPDQLESERLRRIRAETEAEALRSLLHGIDVIVWEADAETGRYWYVSPRAEPLLGYPAENWLEQPDFWSEIIQAEDRSMARAHRSRCLRDLQPGEVEYRVVTADGRTIWLRESVSVEVDSAGKPRALRGCLWDISRRKKVERQLYTDRRKLAEHLADVWHLYLLGGQLLATVELGPVLEEILASVTALHGADLGLIRLLDPESRELEAAVSQGLSGEYLAPFGRVRVGVGTCGLAVERGQPVIIEDVELEGACCAGRHRGLDPSPAASWTEVGQAGGFRATFSVPLISRRGDLVGTIAIFFQEPHRPTERQLQMVEQYVLQAADAIDNARRHVEARESERRKEEFLATLGHELRNPLAAIQTCAHLIQPDEVAAESLGEVREMIIRQSRHMARLIEDLLDLTRVSRGTLAVRKEPVELAEVVARAVGHVRPLVRDRRHELTVAIPEGSTIVQADPMRLEQVLANLLTNAAKYTDPGGRIELIAAPEGDDLVLRVSDTGIGLAPEALPGLFRLYTQLDAARERSRGGLGIGLALVKSLVELHGGTVSAHSEGPGRGSEFVVRLPIGVDQRVGACSPA
ncbi:MAG: PAS domain-containing sensor histidine kinase [Isosphaeraceae bacterium]